MSEFHATNMIRAAHDMDETRSGTQPVAWVAPMATLHRKPALFVSPGVNVRRRPPGRKVR